VLKLAQLSDLHLLTDPSEERWGLNPQALFDQVLALALSQQPDALLLTGDLAHEEDQATYQRLQQQLEGYGLPILAIPGNHDNADLIQQTFGEPLLDLDEVIVIGLNSHIRGSDSGFLGDQELNRAEALIKASHKPVILALHHHPLEVGSAWIDELSLVDADTFNDLVKQQANKIAAVICGHVHQVFESDIGGVPFYSCPSTNRQFKPGAEDFATDELRPGCRIFTVEQGQLRSQVLRIH
jgi:Icc protein